MQPIDVTVHSGEVALEGALSIPAGAEGVVLFAHGSGSSRFRPRNRFVATVLNQGGLGTLLLDLLTAEEHEIDERSGALRFDIDLLSRRLIKVGAWGRPHPTTGYPPTGLLAPSPGGGPPLTAAGKRRRRGPAVFPRGGRPAPARA